MKFLTLVIALTAPLAAHAWTGHVYSTQAECIDGCSAKVKLPLNLFHNLSDTDYRKQCQAGGGIYDGCSGGGGATAQDLVAHGPIRIRYIHYKGVRSHFPSHGYINQTIRWLKTQRHLLGPKGFKFRAYEKPRKYIDMLWRPFLFNKNGISQTLDVIKFQTSSHGFVILSTGVIYCMMTFLADFTNEWHLDAQEEDKGHISVVGSRIDVDTPPLSLGPEMHPVDCHCILGLASSLRRNSDEE
ncbi:hypothetical protein Landi51_10278 [Colletotrichum acutatum]